MIITATTFTLKSWRLYGEFFIDTYRVVKQVRSAGGIVKAKIKPVSLKTITAWKSKEEMILFRNSGAHLHAMKKSSHFGSIHSVTWESDHFPSWKMATEKLNQN